MNINSKITVRTAVPGDEAFIISLIPRLTDFGAPAYRDINAMAEWDAIILKGNLLNPGPGKVIFIAEDEYKNRLGFVHLFPGDDYYNKEKHGHISDLIVSAEAEGKGVGQLLINKAEEWAIENEFKWLTLSVFAENHRARKLYDKLGFKADMMKYIKELK